jgi:hypothetical protein
MGGSVIRRNVIKNVNEKFGAKSIKKSAKELHPLVEAGGDFFDMWHRYGILNEDIKNHKVGGDLSRYKEVQSMPHLHKVLLTHAFRHAVTHKPNPLPVQFDVVSGDEEGLEVKTSKKSVNIKLTRADPPSWK